MVKHPGLQCSDVHASYGRMRALRGVSLDVAPGEWVAVLGPNGAGKSTLIKVLAGLVPMVGVAAWNGEPLESLGRRRRAGVVAVVPQDPIVPAGTPVLDYVLLGRTPYISYWGTETAADIEIARKTIAGLDLAGFEGRGLETLSGGERQRAVLARALAQQAELLLLDEPTAALDLGHQQSVMDHVDRLRTERQIAVLSAVHDLTLAAQYADRLVMLDHGRVVAAGKAAEVLTVENIVRYYGATVTVLADDAGDLVVAPRRS